MVMKLHCNCFDMYGSTWRQLPPGEMHRYRVQCGACGKFAKWGAEAELEWLIETNARVIVIPYLRGQNTILSLFEEDDLLLDDIVADEVPVPIKRCA